MDVAKTGSMSRFHLFFETTQMLILVRIRVGELREWKKIFPIDGELRLPVPSFS